MNRTHQPQQHPGAHHSLLMRSHNECVIQIRNVIFDIVNNLIAFICNYEINS